MSSKFQFIIVMFLLLSFNISAQTAVDHDNKQPVGTQRYIEHKKENIKNSIYVLDGNIITYEDFKAMSLAAIKSRRHILSKNDPIFKKYAKDGTVRVTVITSAKNIEESLLNPKNIDIDTSCMFVMLVDGVEVSSCDLHNKVDPHDIVKMEIVRDASVCNVFAPRTGGVIFFTTKSKPFLSRLVQKEQEHIVESLKKTNEDTTGKIIFNSDHYPIWKH